MTVQNTEQFTIKAGVLSRGRSEAGGVGEDYEIRLWIHHKHHCNAADCLWRRR